MSWWHGLEGGAVAEQRPPPPNADAPYPNLATVPPKPTPSDPATRTRIASALIADRANAQYAASQAPIADPSSRSASPSLFGGAVPPPPPVDPDASSASLPAASAPPAPPHPATVAAPVAPPSRAPRTGVSSAPLPPVAAASQAPPTVPDAPPPAPNLPGVAIPVTAATPPPKAPPPPPAAQVAATEADRVPVAFAPGSAVLPPGADAPLKKLIAVAAKGSATIVITGYGDATVTTPAVQTSGVRLALLRAQAMQAVFTGAGVPAARLRIDAQAAGTGGEARLVN